MSSKSLLVLTTIFLPINSLITASSIEKYLCYKSRIIGGLLRRMQYLSIRDSFNLLSMGKYDCSLMKNRGCLSRILRESNSRYWFWMTLSRISCSSSATSSPTFPKLTSAKVCLSKALIEFLSFKDTYPYSRQPMRQTPAL